MEFEFHPLANLFPLIEGEDFDDLVADVNARGIHQPIDIYQGKILDGRNRYRAAQAAGVTIEPRDLRYFRPEMNGDPLDYVLSQNLRRRHLNESQRAMVAARLATMRQGRPPTPAEKPANLPVNQPTAAARLSISERALRMARTVQTRAAPELARAVDSGRLAVSVAAAAADLPAETQRRIAEQAERGEQSAARTLIKQERRDVRERTLAATQCALPTTRAGVILEDFEWHFQTFGPGGMDRHAANHYETARDALTPAEIVARTAERFSIAADDCVTFMWATNPHLWIAMQVMYLRGFSYKSNYVWGKDKIGPGYWNREKHEILLIGVKGNIPCPAPGTQWDSLVIAPRGEHSEKPDLTYEMIETYFPTLPKVELNARKVRAGWIGWGNQYPQTSGEAAA